MTEMTPESAPVASDPAVSPNPFEDAPTTPPEVTDPAVPADAPTLPAPTDPTSESAPAEAPSEAPNETPAASEGTVRVQMVDDGEGQAIVLGNHFVGLSPTEIPADMLSLFEDAAAAQGRKIVSV